MRHIVSDESRDGPTFSCQICWQLERPLIRGKPPDIVKIRGKPGRYLQTESRVLAAKQEFTCLGFLS
jgi:hypothetical protein